ncbi:hypothetical protein ACJIZ3_003890 [Penstemon smallii]|uniref:2Fe-2S ferredoxin-type domain-containing protein n=1 Tax=Penstemon smallii TaxID=265156 RepID=A0ABD3S0J9_9LAMI
MDIHTPCSACFSINHKPALARQSLSSRNIRFKTKSQLQTPVSVNGGVQSPSIQTHKVTVHDRQRGVVHEFFVPEDQYILHTAEDQNINLPFACRHDTALLFASFSIYCCTSCAVRVKFGQLRQPEALGISAELKSKGYALLCRIRSYDNYTNLLLMQVHWLQFGRYFARGPIDRDDYALELAMGDE